MIPPTSTIPPETNAAAPAAETGERSTNMSGNSLPAALGLAADVAERYDLDALTGLIARARALAAGAEISVAVLGRFKAGKSSFLNHFLGRDVLPVGVVPVTAVVTAIRFGENEGARVHHRDGRNPEVPLNQIGCYISEKENPENAKDVTLITVELPELRRFRGLQFVDTPGLDSALSHNTRTALDWLPHAGLALVAVSVDPPLSQRDIDLLKSLYRYTPKVAVLLTKADLLSVQDLREVSEYVRTELARNFTGTIRVFPYSTRPGFEYLREALEAELAGGTLEHFAEERESILMRKLDTLLRECGDYLALSLKSAEMLQSERQAIQQQLLGENEALNDAKKVIRLLVQEAAGGARADISHRLEAHRPELEQTLLAAFETEFSEWTKSPSTMRRSFEDWLANALRDELTAFSDRHRDSLLEPLREVRERTFRVLQQFRDKLSDSTMRGFGIALRTTETGIGGAEPKTPNVRIGRVFDKNWEVLSPILPAYAIEATVRRHFARAIPSLVEQNLSRLGAQWEEGIKGGLQSVEMEALRRLNELMTTVQRLLTSGNKRRVPQLRADLERIEAARQSLFAETAD
jgi:GTP-binding protein EngB required for normal cell division